MNMESSRAMMNMSAGQWSSAAGDSYPFNSFAWSDSPIIDACSVEAEYGHLVCVTSDGALYGVDLDTGSFVKLGEVILPDRSPDEDALTAFGTPAYRLHASSNGYYVAIVVDHGHRGVVVDTRSGEVTMNLHGGDYYEETVPFSACFLRFEGRDVFVHRTDWNRLEASDPATGRLLTERVIAPYEEGGNRPDHYLDYFHGRIVASPDGARIVDDGWVWHPLSVPRTWSVDAWLRSNPWESEDGGSKVDLTLRDDWNTPLCWISDQHVVLWGLGNLNSEELEETDIGPGVRIFDSTIKDQPADGGWPMQIAGRVRDLFSDGRRLIVVADSGTTVWDIQSRLQTGDLGDFAARAHHRGRNSLITVQKGTVVELMLASECQP